MNGTPKRYRERVGVHTGQAPKDNSVPPRSDATGRIGPADPVVTDK